MNKISYPNAFVVNATIGLHVLYSIFQTFRVFTIYLINMYFSFQNITNTAKQEH